MSVTTITIHHHGDDSVTPAESIIQGPALSVQELKWARGSDVAEILHISTPTASGGATLGPPQLIDGAWTVLDTLGTISQTYNYTVTLLTTGGNTIIHDPEIINDPTGG